MPLHLAPSTPTITLRVARLVPLLLFLAVWEFATWLDPSAVFFFGRPTRIAQVLITDAMNGSVFVNLGVTLGEAAAGFVLGSALGTMFGLLLWQLPRVFFIAEPYVIALGAAPAFALAPVLIIWFGTGIVAKIAIATISTVFVAVYQAYWGASSASHGYLTLMRTFRATRGQVFRKVIAPSAIVWVMRAFRMNVSFALLGAFIGEFISSNQGLGHMILVASGLFNMSRVLAGVFLFVLCAFILLGFVSALEKRLTDVVARRL
jgi:NitT/TauT family transport system permease protein